MNTNAKGYRSQKKTQAYLEERGWTVHTVPRPSRAGQKHDYFGEFDHMAMCQNPKMFRLPMLIQTKSNSTGGCLKSIKSFVEKHSPTFVALVFVWHDRKEEPTIHEYDRTWKKNPSWLTQSLEKKEASSSPTRSKKNT